MTRITVIVLCILLFSKIANSQDKIYLNNPNTGITTYDVNIKEKSINNSNQNAPLATRFNYIYLSDILTDECINGKNNIDKDKLYENIKICFDRLINYSKNQRHNIRIFPEYNGSGPCKNSTVIPLSTMDDGKLLINYPQRLYDIISRQKYPPFIIKAIFPKGFKVTKNIALLDMRNKFVQRLYDAIFESLSRYLEEKVKSPHLVSSTTATDSCRKGDFIGRIEMGFVEPWGEGMTTFYGQNVDTESYIRIAEMYKKYFKGYNLIAPSFGMRINTTTNKNLYAFQYYLLTTKYGSLRKKKNLFSGHKEFGLFIDHIGTRDCNWDFTLSYKGEFFRPIALKKYRSAAVIGENSGEIDRESPIVMKNIKEFGISLCNIWTSKDVTSIPDSAVQGWKNAANYLGYRFYLSNLQTTIKDNRLHVYFHLGNRSYSPLYDDFWLPQIVIRNSNNSILKVIGADKFINLKSIPCLKDSFKYEVMVNKTIPLMESLPKGAKVYFRVIDKCHINENMFFDNEGRTEHGEYLLSINN